MTHNLTDAEQEVHERAEAALKTNAEAYRLAQEALDMRAERNAALVEVKRLQEQLRIATDFLESLAAQRGLDMRYPGEHAAFAEDALIQMSVVE